jgi:hypothetical protein
MKLQLLKPEKPSSSAAGINPTTPEESCPWLVVDADAEKSLASINMTPWRFVTKVRRPTDDNEDVLLYRRAD